MQKISAGVQTSQFLQRRVSGHLLHRYSVRMIRDSGDRYSPVAQMNEEQHSTGGDQRNSSLVVSGVKVLQGQYSCCAEGIESVKVARARRGVSKRSART